jgi:hypothetical protein
VLLKKLRTLGKFKIGIQKVDPIGMALKNKVFYRYNMFNKKIVYSECVAIKNK